MRMPLDVTPPPPSYSKPGEIIGWMAVMAFLSVLGWVGVKITGVGLRSGGREAESSASVKMLDGTVHRITSDDPGLVAAVKDLAATVADQSQRLSQTEADLASEREHSRAQDEKLAAVTSILTRLRTKAAPIIGWIDAGANPPAPDVDAEFRELLRDPD